MIEEMIANEDWRKSLFAFGQINGRRGGRRKAEENLTVENNRQPSSFRLEALRRNDCHHFELHHQVRMGETDDADERAGR